MRPEDLWWAEVRAELWSEHHWEDLWCRTYGVGLYASIAEWAREQIRRVSPWFRG